MIARTGLLRTVRARLLIAAILIEALMLTLLVGNSLRLLHEHMTLQAREHAAQMAPVLIAALVAPLAQLDHATVQAVLEESRTSEGIDYLAVSNPEGRLIASTGWPEGQPLPVADQTFDMLAKDAPRHDVVVPVMLAGQSLGTLHFGINLSHILAARRQLLWQGIALALTELLLSSALLALIGYWMTRHVAALIRASGEVAAGNLTPGRVPEGDDEIGRLGLAFNAMSRAVAERIQDLTTARDQQAALAGRLKQEHSRLIALLAAMDVGVLFVDGNDRVVYENPVFRQIWGIPAGLPASGLRLPALFASAQVATAEPGIHRPDPSGGQRELMLQDGRVITERGQAVKDSDGHALGWLWLYEDVTALRVATRELLAAKEAAEAGHRAKSAFIANMSHELRTPMNAIIGFTSLMQLDPLNPEHATYLSQIESSAKHLLSVINDILDFSKLDAGALCIEQGRFELSEVIDKVIGPNGILAEQKGLALRREIAPGVPGALLGDALRLGQVLSNFTSNAVKFTEQGEIVIRVELESRAGEQVRLRFSVRDTGIGLSEEQKGRLFRSFEQGDMSLTRRYGGTGLGLAISKRLVELMGGEIGVDSQLGQGATFWCSIPFRLARPDRAADAQPGRAGV